MASMTVQLRTDLDRLTTGADGCRHRVQHAVAIAETGRALTIQQVRIDARHLRCHVRTYAQRTTGNLVDQLEGTQLEIMAGAGEQRIEIFDQRRHHQLVAMRAEEVEDRTALLLDAPPSKGNASARYSGSSQFI